MNCIDTDVFLPHLAHAFFITLLASLTFLMLLKVASSITGCIHAFQTWVRLVGSAYRHLHRGEDLGHENVDLENGEVETTKTYMVLVLGKMKDEGCDGHGWDVREAQALKDLQQLPPQYCTPKPASDGY